jgi:hypothetical protein
MSQGSGWAIHPLTGNLLRFQQEKIKSFESKNIPELVTKSLKLCDEPYRLSPTKLDITKIDNKKRQTNIPLILYKSCNI